MFFLSSFSSSSKRMIRESNLHPLCIFANLLSFIFTIISSFFSVIKSGSSILQSPRTAELNGEYLPIKVKFLRQDRSTDPPAILKGCFFEKRTRRNSSIARRGYHNNGGNEAAEGRVVKEVSGVYDGTSLPLVQDKKTKKQAVELKNNSSNKDLRELYRVRFSMSNVISNINDKSEEFIRSRKEAMQRSL